MFFLPVPALRVGFHSQIVTDLLTVKDMPHHKNLNNEKERVGVLILHHLSPLFGPLPFLSFFSPQPFIYVVVLYILNIYIFCSALSGTRLSSPSRCSISKILDKNAALSGL